MSSDSGQYEAYTVVAAIWNIYVVITTVLFLAQNRKDFIRKRNISCCMLQVISGIAMGNSCLARMNFWPVIASNFPWLLIVIINYTMFFNWMLSYFLRTIILLNDWYTNRIGSIIQRKMDLDKVEELVEQLKPSRAELLLLNFQKKLSVEDTNLPSENAYLKYDRARILEIRLGVKRGIGSRQVLKCLGVFACFEVVLILIVLAYSGGFTSKAFDPSISQNGKDGLPVVVFVVLFLLADGYFLYLMRNVIIIAEISFFLLGNINTFRHSTDS
ncbi:hypothetical protein BKA69DRAFT_1056242 [Paraphysoderma sedebokerense]|nr:hypothetical protein BKA69DRAFT_1056242 [Paraphysoderma sedebokerense]